MCPPVRPITVVAPDWLARFSSEQRLGLFDRWFDRAPAAALLTALVRWAAAQPVQLQREGAPSSARLVPPAW